MDAPLDVVVVGAGPGGIAAALTARAQGLDVEVIDKARFPRDKTCGDCLTAHAVRLLERLGLPAVALGEPAGAATVTEAVVVAPGGRRVTLPLPADGLHAVVVPRRVLDAELVALARAQDIPVREGVEPIGVERTGSRVRVRCRDGSVLAARHLVAADGHFSAIRRALHPTLPVDLGESHALRQYWSDVEERRLWVGFDPEALPGYAWVFPLPGGRANVGFGVPRAGRSGADLKRLWTRLGESEHLRATLGPRAVAEGPARAWPVPTRFDPSRLAEDRVCFVGDAAGVVDPLTGEGVAQALESGALAAAAIAAGGPPAAVAERYRQEVTRALGRDLRLAARLQRVLRSPRALDAALRAVDLGDWTRRSFARWLFEDYPRAVLATPSRWGRRTFTPPGAYAPG